MPAWPQTIFNTCLAVGSESGILPWRISPQLHPPISANLLIPPQPKFNLPKTFLSSRINPAAFKAALPQAVRTYTLMVHPQVAAHAASLRDPDSFWLPLARKLITWDNPPTRALVNASSSPNSKWSWFPDGTLNTCYNCVDRHPPSRVAIQYVSSVADIQETITYGQLQQRVESVAAVLKHELRVKKGDTVILYSKVLLCFC